MNKTPMDPQTLQSTNPPIACSPSLRPSHSATAFRSRSRSEATSACLGRAHTHGRPSLVDHFGSIPHSQVPRESLQHLLSSILPAGLDLSRRQPDNVRSGRLSDPKLTPNRPPGLCAHLPYTQSPAKPDHLRLAADSVRSVRSLKDSAYSLLHLFGYE